MKVAVKIIILLGVCCSLMLYSACSKKHPAPPSITDQQIAILTKTDWKVSAVTKDGVDQMADYQTFTMTLTGAAGAKKVTYATGGRTASKYPWDVSGDLTFDDTNPATTLLRNDNLLPVTYAATSTQLTMSFNYSGPGFNARELVVTGAWVFTFVPKP